MEEHVIENHDKYMNEIQQRFANEDIDINRIKPEDRLIYVWRWLIGAETDLKDSYETCKEIRHEYVFKGRMDSDTKRVNEAQEQLEEISSEISKIEIVGDTLVQKVKNLVSEFQWLRQKVCSMNANDNRNDMISEMVKLSSERDSAVLEKAELTEKVESIQKRSKELELDNEKLVFKLSEAFAELEEKEIRLGELITVCSENVNPLNSLNYSNHNECSYSSPNAFSKQEEDEKYKSDHKNKSDVCDDSLFSSLAGMYNSPSKLSSIMSSCHEVARLEENRKLQSECESVKSRISSLGEKYNTLALKFIQLKSKRKFQLEQLRGRLEASQCQIETLQVQLSAQRQRLRAEEMFRKQIEADMRRLQDEKRNMSARLMNAEMEQKETNREMIILRKKISMLDSANSELLEKLLKFKYKEAPMPKSTQDILPIGSV